MEGNHSLKSEIQACQTDFFTASQSRALSHIAGEFYYAEATLAIRED